MSLFYMMNITVVDDSVTKGARASFCVYTQPMGDNVTLECILSHNLSWNAILIASKAR